MPIQYFMINGNRIEKCKSLIFFRIQSDVFPTSHQKIESFKSHEKGSHGVRGVGVLWPIMTGVCFQDPVKQFLETLPR